jgi:4-diphosphocytidyl-2-C-methyl-D-erythritol kinase
MTSSVRVLAPAKINWRLEVLGKRPDGYHEVRTILQTIDLCDEITLSVTGDLTLAVEGWLANERPESNLVYRAALLLRERAGYRGGAEIKLTKRIAIAAGLGGGSSDAAAVLRALRALWELDITDQELASIAAELGSDVSFFLRGGTALAAGRGEIIELLPDAQAQRISIASPPLRVVADKTARMYAALRPEHFTDGSRTEQLAERIRQAQPVQDEDCFNVFEAVLAEADSEAAAAFEAARASGRRPHLCGSGPAYFTLGAGGARTLTAAQATPLTEVI